MDFWFPEMMLKRKENMKILPEPPSFPLSPPETEICNIHLDIPNGIPLPPPPLTEQTSSNIFSCSPRSDVILNLSFFLIHPLFVVIPSLFRTMNEVLFYFKIIFSN
jgi:hypothetical protein